MGACSSTGPESANAAFMEAAKIQNSQLLAERQMYTEKQRLENRIEEKESAREDKNQRDRQWPKDTDSDKDSVSSSRGRTKKNQVKPQPDNGVPPWQNNNTQSQQGRLPPILDKRPPTPPSIYTDHELYDVYPELTRTVLVDFKDAVTAMRTQQDKYYFQEIYDLLNDKVWLPFRDSTHKDEQRLMAYHMAKIGFAKAATAYYQYVLDREDKDVFTGKNYTKSLPSQLLSILRQIVDRFSNSHKKLGVKMGQAGFLALMVADLKVLKKEIRVSVDDGTCFAINTALGVLYSCSKAESNGPLYQEMAVTHVVEPYLKAVDTEIKVVAAVTLSAVMEEELSPSVVDDDDLFDLMVGGLNNAWRASTKQYRGYSTVDIAQAIARLAVTDKVKKIVMTKGVLGPLIAMLQEGDLFEQEAAARAVWVLSFNMENKVIAQNNEQLMHALDDIKEDRHGVLEVVQAATGALWILRDQELYATTKGARERYRQQKAGVNDHPQRHVMISYNSQEQKKPLKIRDELEDAGYVVWLDVDHTDEPMPEARIDAVENAAAVLICMSHKYKQEPVNRTEADYAHELSVPIIPLLVQGKYTPDGWLKKMLGKSYVDFSKNATFDKAMNELIDQLGYKGKKNFR